MEYLAGVSCFGLRLCTHLAFPYTFLFVCYFLFSVLCFIPPYAIVNVGVGDVASRDLLRTFNGSGMTGTLSIWSLANNVHLHNYYLHIYYCLYTFRKTSEGTYLEVIDHMMYNPDQSASGLFP